MLFNKPVPLSHKSSYAPTEKGSEMLPAPSFGQLVFLGRFPDSTEPGKDDSDTSGVGGLKAIDQNVFLCRSDNLVIRGPAARIYLNDLW